MKETLIIYIHSYELNKPSWMVFNDENELIQEKYQGDATLLKTESIDREIIVLVPAQDISIAWASLPKLSKSKLQQALPFALEEYVADDIEKLHFAPGQLINDAYPVAIVSHDKMKNWLSLIQSWEIKPDMLTSSMFALPYDNHSWYGFIDDMLIMRTGLFSGFISDIANAQEMLKMAIQKETPNQITIYNFSNERMTGFHAFAQDAELNATDLGGIKINEIKKEKKEFLTIFASNIKANINLLQNAYHIKKTIFPKKQKIVKVLSGLCALWVFSLLAYPVISYCLLKHRLNSIQNEIAVIYKKHFPNANSVVAPTERMKTKFERGANFSEQNKVLNLLALIGKGLNQSNGIVLKRFDYQNNALSLTLTATSSDDFSNFTDALQQLGLKVAQQNADLVGSHINATVTIS